MKAVVIGPGRIGCGLVGQLLRESGWEVVFLGRSATVEALDRRLIDMVERGLSSGPTA